MIRWQHAALAAATAGVLCAAAAPAAATTTASASLGPLSLQLIDLDPLDGIAPSISFLSPTGSSGSSASVSAGEAFGTNDVTRYGQRSWQPLTATTSTPLTDATASLSGPGNTPLDASLTASGRTANPGTDGDFRFAWFAAGVFGPTQYADNFVASARTQIVISAMATVQGTVGNIQGGFATSDWFLSEVKLSVSGSNPPGVNSQLSSDGLGVTGSSSDGSFAQFVESRMLSVSLVNATGADFPGTLYASANAGGSMVANTPPIPEPATALTMLAGLAALGAIVRRRRAA